MAPVGRSRLSWARGVVADVAHHDVKTVRLACAVLVRRGDEDEQTEADQLLRMMQPDVSIPLLRHNQQVAGAPRDQMDASEQLAEPAPGAPQGRRCADCFQQIATDGAGHSATCIYEGQPAAFPRCR